MAASAQPSAPSLAELPLQHVDVAAAWPLYSPSAALSCKRGSGELQSRTLDSATDNLDEVAGGGEVDPPPPPRYRSFLLPGVAAAVPHNNDNDYSHKKNEDLFVLTSTTGGAAADVGGGKSQPQREKDDEEDRGRRDGTAEVVVCLRENKLKAESDLELLHSSRGTPIPTRRKKGTAPSSPATSPPLPLSTLGQSKSAHHHLNIRGSTHINIRSSNSNMTTLDGSSDLKRKQYEQFMAMAQVMKGDSFDTMEEISPPTSPRFLTVSTGSGLMGLKSQQHRYHTHVSNSKNLIEGSGAVAGLYSAAAAKSHSRPPLPSSPVSSSAAGSSSSPSSARFQSFLLLAFITLFIAGTILLTASYSTSPRLFSFSSKGSSRSASGRVTNPEDLDNTWLAERDRLRGRVKSFEIDPLVDQTIRNLNLQPSEDEDDPDAPIDDSYKYRDYTFLLHNALPRVAQNGTVIMVIANSGYLEFLLNWKSYVDAHNITNYVIIPSDVQMAQQLSYLGVDWAYDPEIGMDALSQSVSYTTDKGSRAWANWNKVVHKKSHYFKKIVEMGYSVMVSDIDMVWLKNPFTAMGDADVDIFFTNDGSAPNKDMSICGGLFYGKNREKSLAFINHVIDCEVTQKKKEQLCMNMWLGSVSGKTNTINISASEAPNYKIMGVDDFPSGAYFFSNKWAGTEFPYVVHNNWIVGKANKLKRFKAFGYWRVDDSSLRNLMINFRFDDHRGKPGRGREGEIADELMVYHTEMRKKFGRFDDRIWLLEKPPVPRMKAADAKPVTKKATVTTTVTSAKAPVRTAAKKTNASAPAKVGPPRKVTPKREPTRNSKYKYIDGNRNPHYSSGR